MTGLDLKFAFVEISNIVVTQGLNLFVQSAVLISAGLLVANLSRPRGSALVSTILRATLVAVMVCPLASFLLDSIGFSGLSIDPPKASLYTFEPIGADPDLDVAKIHREFIETEGASGLDPRILNQIQNSDWGEGEPMGLPNDSDREMRVFGMTGGASRLATLYAELTALWLSISAMLFARLAFCHYKLSRIGKGPRCVDERLLSERDTVCRPLGIQPPRIVLSQKAQSPCLFGILRPAILLPATSELSKQVLVHEMAHLVRRDPLWKLLGNLLASILWFQPLVWVLKKKMDKASEEVCDDYVLSLEEDRKSYARYLVKISESLRPTVPEVTAGAGVVAFKSILGKRVERILDTSRGLSTRTGVWACLLVFVLGAGGVFSVAFLGISGSSLAEAKEKTRVEVELGPIGPKEWIVDLQNGAAVQLVGICEHPSASDSEWWGPDGTPLDDPPYETLPSVRLKGGRNTDRGYEMLFAFEGPSTMTVGSISAAESTVSGSGRPRKLKWTGKPIVKGRAFVFPASIKRTDIKVKIGLSDWKTISSYRIEGGGEIFSQGFQDGGVVFHRPIENDDGLSMTVASSYVSLDSRLVAILRDGRSVTPASSSSGSVANLISWSFKFDASLSDIEEFQFQTRPFASVKFSNVSLRHGERTEPRILVEQDEIELDLQRDVEKEKSRKKMGLDTILEGVELWNQTLSETLYLLRELSGNKFEFEVSEEADRAHPISIAIIDPMTIGTILETLEERYPIQFDMTHPGRILVTSTSDKTASDKTASDKTASDKTISPIEYVEPPIGSTIRYYRDPVSGGETYEYLAPPNKEDPILIYTEPKSATLEPAYRVWADKIVWSNATQSATATGNVVVEGPDGSRIESATGIYAHRQLRLDCPGEVTVIQTRPNGKKSKVVAESAAFFFESTGIISARFDKTLIREYE